MPRGLPCVLVPDVESSRLAPGWLLHDSALPGVIRLLAVDPPGIGVSDPIGFGGFENPAEDLRRLVETLAVGRVALIGIGQGADDAFAFAARYPAMVASVSGVSMRLPRETRRGHAGSPLATRPARAAALGRPALVVDQDRRAGRRPDRGADLVADAATPRRHVGAGAGGPLEGAGLP